MIQYVDIDTHILHERRHFGHRSQIWQSDVFTVAEQTAVWVVRSSLHESHEGASHNPKDGKDHVNYLLSVLHQKIHLKIHFTRAI